MTAPVRPAQQVASDRHHYVIRAQNRVHFRTSVRRNGRTAYDRCQPAPKQASGDATESTMRSGRKPKSRIFNTGNESRAGLPLTKRMYWARMPSKQRQHPRTSSLRHELRPSRCNYSFSGKKKHGKSCHYAKQSILNKTQKQVARKGHSGVRRLTAG